MKRKSSSKRPKEKHWILGSAGLWLAGIFIALLGIAIVLVHPREPLVLTNTQSTHRTDLSLAQYSDTHISEQAIVANPSLAAKTFAKLFGANPPSAHSGGGGMTADVINSLQTTHPPLAAATTLSPNEQEYGTWLWTPTLQMTPAYMDTILSGAKQNGINVVYLSIDSYLDIYAEPDSVDLSESSGKSAQEKLFSDTLETFIQKAHGYGIQVDAEAGWRNWAETGNTYKAFAILDYVVNFNATHTEKLRGFQYDIEPYLLDNYSKDESGVLQRFVTLINQSTNFLGGSDLHFTVVIPSFFDDQIKWTPQFTYGGKNEYTYNHLLDILDTRANSTLILMSYRNTAQGTDSTIDISQTEMNEAIGHATRVIVAQETGEVQPAYVTFFQMPKSYYESQVALVEKAFDKNPNFGGMAVHYANAFLTLK